MVLISSVYFFLAFLFHNFTKTIFRPRDAGNVPEQINLRSPHAKSSFTNTSLYHFMHKHVHQKNTLMSCCIVPGVENDGDAGSVSPPFFVFFITAPVNELPKFFIFSHLEIHPTLTYTITSIFNIKIRMSNMRRRTVQLVKLRSPWGVVKFKGAWSLLSQAVPKREMKRLGLVCEEEGEFVMSFEVRYCGEMMVGQFG